MKIYYAHCKAIYDTPQEFRDLDTLRIFGEVVNPNSYAVEEALRNFPPGSDPHMAYFESFADTCDVIAFRALPDGSIPSGVAKEIEWFKQRKKPVIELPSGISRRVISLEQTREYLNEVGQR